MRNVYFGKRGIARRARTIRKNVARTSSTSLSRRRRSSVLCDSKKTVTFNYDTEEGAAEFDADIDHWTEGSLHTLLDEAEDERDTLQSPQDLTMEDLATSFARSQVRKSQCEVLVNDARDAILASQQRTDIADYNCLHS